MTLRSGRRYRGSAAGPQGRGEVFQSRLCGSIRAPGRPGLSSAPRYQLPACAGAAWSGSAALDAGRRARCPRLAAGGPGPHARQGRHLGLADRLTGCRCRTWRLHRPARPHAGRPMPNCAGYRSSRPDGAGRSRPAPSRTGRGRGDGRPAGERVLHRRRGSLSRCAAPPSRPIRARLPNPVRSRPVSAHHLPVLGMEAHGSAGALGPPRCSSSTETLSGERTKAM